VYPQRHVALEKPVPRLVERALGREGHEVVEPERRLERTGELVEQAYRWAEWRRRDTGRRVHGGECSDPPKLAGTPQGPQIGNVGPDRRKRRQRAERRMQLDRRTGVDRRIRERRLRLTTILVERRGLAYRRGRIERRSPASRRSWIDRRGSGMVRPELNPL